MNFTASPPLSTQLEQTLPNLPKVITDVTFLCTLAFTLHPLGACKHAHTCSHLLKSPLSTPVLHFQRRLAERGCRGRRAPAPPPPLPAVLICLFSVCPPLLLLVLPSLPPSYSPSQCECVLKCLPALCNIEGSQHTDEGESGLWADRPGRKQGLHCTADRKTALLTLEDMAEATPNSSIVLFK